MRNLQSSAQTPLIPIFIAVIFASMRLDWLLPNVKGIPVLMYHRIWPGQQDGLTITPEQLREQWTWLKNAGYEAISMQDFLSVAAGKTIAPPKAVLLTFDDGYANNLTYVYPLLREFNWQATIFIIAGTLDATVKATDETLNQYLTVTELRSMDPKYIQFGLHGYQHENFSKFNAAELKKVMEQSFTAFQKADVEVVPVLAYPYGARPDTLIINEVKNYFRELGLKAAFRIGNKPEKTPSADIFEIKRIDIRGEDSLEDFKIKLKKGKLKPF